MRAAEYNGEGRWAGFCDRCGTNHPESGLDPSTFGGAAECLGILKRHLGSQLSTSVQDSIAAIRARNLAALRAAWNQEPPAPPTPEEPNHP